MRKILSVKEVGYVIVIFIALGLLGVLRYRVTSDRYKIYLANVVATRIENTLLRYHKGTVSYVTLRDTVINDYHDFRVYFSDGLPDADFKRFLYITNNRDYYISITVKDTRSTEILRSSRSKRE